MIKLQELLIKYGRYISFHKDIVSSEVKCENDKIIITYSPSKPITDSYINLDKTVVDYTIDLSGKLNPDADVELNCYWYYGAMPADVLEQVQEAIGNRDYEAYSKLRLQVWDTDYAWCMPKTICLDIDNQPLGSIDIMDKFLFEHIDNEECEHG
jgi:hypothetical protein